MPTLFSNINLALSSMLAQQYSMSITEHNVANANTEGYRRQRAVLRTGPAISTNGAYTFVTGLGQFGSGVEVGEIERISVGFYDGRYRSEVQQTKRYDVENTLLTQLESQLSETSTAGVLPKLDSFFTAWQTLSTTPTDSALKTQLVDSATDLVSSLNSRAVQLTQMRGDQDVEIVQRVTEINQTAEQLAALNGEISRVYSVGEQPNDLLDQRDMLLDRLAEVAGATSSIQANGQAIVSINNHVLVSGNRNYALEANEDPAKNDGLASITWKDDGQAMVPVSGELAGYINVRDTYIPKQQAALNSLAAAVIDRVNEVHSSGFASGKIVTNSTTAGTITSFGAATTTAGNLEYATGSYFIETQNDPTNGWQYRLVDASGNPPTFTDGTTDATGWQNFPAAGSTVDTGHGLTITFGNDATAYAARDRTNGAAQVTFTQQQNFFIGTDAMSMRVNSAIISNTSLVATSEIPNAPGNGENARQLFNIRSEQLMNSDTATVSQFYNQTITELGLTIKQASTNVKSHKIISDALDAQRSSVSGVSLNEEAADMMKFQRAFEAAARLMTTVDEMLDTVINKMAA
jgi:flagellar hook-associated protein 1 FlgK